MNKIQKFKENRKQEITNTKYIIINESIDICYSISIVNKMNALLVNLYNMNV